MKAHINLGSQIAFTYVIMAYGDKKYLFICIALLWFNELSSPLILQHSAV
jgi:hypothetical protein